MLHVGIVNSATQSTFLARQVVPSLALINKILVCRFSHSSACYGQASCSINSSTVHAVQTLVTHKQQSVGPSGVQPACASNSKPAGHTEAWQIQQHYVSPASQHACRMSCLAANSNKPQQVLWNHPTTYWNAGFRLYCQHSKPASALKHEEGSSDGSAKEQQLLQQQQQQQPVSSASEAASSFISAAPAAAARGVPDGAPSAAAASASAAAAAAASVGGVLSGGPTASVAEYTMRQVSKHATDETCWIVVNGKVYDVTSYIDDHPGGADSILQNAGVDCTEEFMGVHSQEAKDLLEKFIIGTVKAGTKKHKPQPATVTADTAAALTAQPVLLTDPREKYALPLAEKKELNHDTFFMRFALPGPRQQLGLPCGKHVFLSADIAGETVVRAYTPISGNRDLGVLDFLIKVYWAGVHPNYPQGGKMTQHLAAMKEGDTVDVKGPYGKFSYEGGGNYTLNRVPGKARYLSMISGGSGVTPCYSVLREVLRDPNDQTRCALIYANKHEEDIWLQQELNAMARDNPDRFHLWYVVEEPGTAPTALHSAASSSAAATVSSTSSPPNVRWTYSKGYITHDMMAQHLLPPRPVAPQQAGDAQQAGSLALMCGPPGMLEHVVVPGLAVMGYTAEQMVVF